MTRKNTIITIVLFVLALLILIVVLSSVFFTVGKISVVWHTDKVKLEDVTNEQVVSSSGLALGTHIFFVDKDDATNSIEKAYPYIKINNIETIFPNTLLIHAQERQAIFALQMETSYYLVDSEFKVLEVVSGEFVSNTTNAIKIEGDFAFDEVAGEFLTASGTLSAFKTLQQSFYENYYEDENEFYVDDMLAFFKSASYTDTKITFETFFGVKVEIYNPSYKQQQKIAMFLLQIESLTETQKTTGTIIIGDYNDKVQGSYTSHVDE